MKLGTTAVSALLSFVLLAAASMADKPTNSPVRAPRSTKELKPARVKRKLTPKKVKAPESVTTTPEKNAQ